jgi:hypothetical protein
MTNLKQTELFPKIKKLTLLQEDTLANLSASQVEKKVKKIRDTSGQSILELSKSSGRLGLLEKTLVDILNSVSTPYLRTWKVKVTPHARLVFQLRASAPTIKEKESGLWQTPTAVGIKERSQEALEKKMKKRLATGRKTVPPGSLTEQIKFSPNKGQLPNWNMWRTPDNMKGGSNLPGIKKALDEGHLRRPSGQQIQIRLQDQVKEERIQPKKWPTPTANEDAAGRPTGKMQKMLGNHPDVRGTGGGTLSPMWVEWLMGYPSGWTDLKVSETAWFPPSPITLDSASSNLTWPTPMARSHSCPRLPETMAKTGRNPLTNTLEDAVQHREIEKRKNWPTPRSRDWKDGYSVPPSVERGTRGHTLGTKVQEEEKKMWPTPMKGDAHLSSTEKIARKRIKEGKITLSRAVQSKMWPTPTSTDGQRGDVKNLDGYRRRKEKWKKKGVNIHKPLDVAVALDEEKKNVEDTDSN